MNYIEQLDESRKLAGLAPLSEEAKLDLVEKKLKGAEKEEFLMAMGKSKKDPTTKKDKEVDDDKPGPTKGARKAMKDADIKPSTKKGKKKVSEHLNAVLEGAGLEPLSEEAAAKVDEAYPEDDAE